MMVHPVPKVQFAQPRDPASTDVDPHPTPPNVCAMDHKQVQLLLEPDGFGLTDGAIRLYRLMPEDIPAATVACSDPQAKAMLAHWVNLSAKKAEDRRIALRNALMGPWAYSRESFGVWRQGRLIGVRFVEPRGTDWHCGGWIHHAWRGAGIGRTALTLALHHVARNRGGTMIATGTRNDNVAAQANLKACGFSHAGPLHGIAREGCRQPTEGMQEWSRDLHDLIELGPIPVSATAWPLRRDRQYASWHKH